MMFNEFPLWWIFIVLREADDFLFFLFYQTKVPLSQENREVQEPEA
jgi:hypothetical protein